MRNKRWTSGLISWLIIFCGCACLLGGCDARQETDYIPEYSDASSLQSHVYVIGVHPLHNPKRLHEIFGPLANYLTDNIPNASFKIEASRNYAAYDEKLYARRFHFSLPNPYQTLNSLKHGYRVFGKMGDDENFRGIILVRNDSGIEKLSDLAGKAISFPAPTALAATMMPQQYMHDHGLDVMNEADIRYVGSQESSVMNVFLGNVAAGATWPPPWRALIKERPELAMELTVKWSTPSLPNNGLVVRDDVSQEITEQVSTLLFSLNTNEQGRKLLARMELSKFEAATNENYAPVLEFLKRFSTTVRPVEF